MNNRFLYGFIFIWMLAIPELIAQETEVESALEIINISSFERDTVYHTQGHIEAPNWSPDGKTLIYNSNGLLYKIPFEGGKETRLTTSKGLDDGPDYSPDGKYIYFNSVRTGTMQIWRMKPDGSVQEQITTDEYHDWFAHPSPDGKWIVYISFGTDVSADKHLPNKNVMLRLMHLDSREVHEMAKLFGGQGTINVPSWSPDSKKVAFVSYRLK